MTESSSPRPDEQPDETPRPPFPAAEPEAAFFTWLRSIDLTRSSDRWVGGVVGGIARRLGIDPTLARGIFVVLGILTMTGPFIYGVLWALLPEPDGRIHAQEAGRGRWSAGMTGAVIFVALSMFGTSEVFGMRWGMNDNGGFVRILLTLGVIGLVIYLITSKRGRDPRSINQDTTQRFTSTGQATDNPSDHSYSYQYTYPGQQPGTTADPRTQYHYDRVMQRQRVAAERAVERMERPKLPGHIALIFLGTALVAAGAVLLAKIEGWLPLPDFGARAAVAAALLVLGLGLLFAAVTRRRGGALVPFTIILLLFTMFSTVRSDANWNTYPAFAGTGMGIEEPVVFGTRTVDVRDMARELTADSRVEITGAFNNVNLKIPDDRRIVVDTGAVFYSVVFTDADGTVTRNSSLIQDNPTTFNEDAEGPTLTVHVSGAFGNLNVTTEAN